jgi:hypothetical protein
MIINKSKYMKPLIKKIAIANLLLLFISNIFGQNQRTDSLKIDDYYIDFSIPDIGAFTLLNIKPDNITTPGSPKELGASILNVVSSKDKITPGLAIDWSPYQTFSNNKSTLDYINAKKYRGLQFTFGSVADSFGTRVATGIKFTLIDQTDPLSDKSFHESLINISDSIDKKINEYSLSYSYSVQKYLYYLDTIRNIKDNDRLIFRNEKIMSNLNQNNPLIIKRELFVNYNILIKEIDSLIIARNNQIKKSNKDNNKNNDTLKLLNENEKNTIMDFCLKLKLLQELKNNSDAFFSRNFVIKKKEWQNNHWNKPVLVWGFGWIGNSMDDKWESLTTQQLKTYLNGSFGIKKYSQISGILAYTYPKNDSISDSTITSKLFFGLRYLIGNSKARFSIDAGYGFSVAEKNDYNKQNLIFTIGTEFKMSDGIYLEIAGGFNSDPKEFSKSANILVLGGLKYAFHKKTRFDLPE